MKINANFWVKLGKVSSKYLNSILNLIDTIKLPKWILFRYQKLDNYKIKRIPKL